jgi:methanogenic corrinoid protein MtbC1
MRQQPIPDESWPEADAMRLVRSFGRARRASPARAEAAPVPRMHDVLAQTVETEVIPRLLMTQRPHAAVVPAVETGHPTVAQVDSFVDLVMHGTPVDSAAYVEGLRAGGTPVESLYLGLLTPAARKLGVFWEEDVCDFSEVTLGVLQLSRILRMLGQAFCGDFVAGGMGPSALLAQMPGEQHGLGLAMVSQFFRRAGWNVREEPSVSSADLVGIVGSQWFGVVGLSVSCNDRLELLAADIKAIRRRSKNPAIGVLVGGQPFLAHPQLAALVGADATAVDGRQAVRQAQSLLSLLAGQS